jgi:hypothetical protein
MSCIEGLFSRFKRALPNFQETAPPVSSSTLVDATRVAEWLRKFNEAFPSFERVAQRGLSPILQKEIQNMTSLLEEGKRIVGSTSHLPVLLDMVDQLVKPRFAQLQDVFTGANRKIAEGGSKLLESDKKLAEKWSKLGLPESVLRYHEDCARFLVDSGLIFAILGYRETCGDVAIHDLKLDGDGHPMIRRKGQFVRWERIASELEYDPKVDKIKSRAYPGGLVQTWNYFHPEGLVDRDRFDYDHIYPIYELSEQEYGRLLAISTQFYKNNPERDPGVAKSCIVQFFTSERRQGIPEHGLFKNLYKNAPVHIGIRLITADRKVYSLGFQMPFEEQEFVLSDYFSTFLATAECKISMLDYEEFRGHEGRRVTSVPLSSQRAQNILDFLNSLNHEQLRFQFARQNCTSLMHEVMQRAGYEVEVRTSGGAVLLDFLPYLNQFPLIGGLIAKVEVAAKRIWEALPKVISQPLASMNAILRYLPDKMGTILVNLLMLKMGAWKKTTPLANGTSEEELYDKKGIQYFSSVIRSWIDIFKDETAVVNHSKYFLDWQAQQKTTFVEPSKDLPRLAIVPPPVH